MFLWNKWRNPIAVFAVTAVVAVASYATFTAAGDINDAADGQAHDRVFAVGDATGYVEPFTGEGMTWALSGGQSVGKIAALAVTTDAIRATRQWQQTWDKLVYRRQKWCWRLAWLLRHPQAARLGVAMLAKYPVLTNSIVNQLNSQPSA